MPNPPIEERLEDVLADLHDAAGCGCCRESVDYDAAVERLRALFAEQYSLGRLHENNWAQDTALHRRDGIVERGWKVDA